MPSKMTSKEAHELLAGWMPASWWGTEQEPKLKAQRRTRKTTTKRGLKKTDSRVALFRRRYQEVTAIVCADIDADRPGYLSFSIESSNRLDGETYFLVLCQTLYRELACKEVLGEPLRGEDLIELLINWWAQGGLVPGNLRSAMRGTSLDLGTKDAD